MMHMHTPTHYNLHNQTCKFYRRKMERDAIKTEHEIGNNNTQSDALNTTPTSLGFPGYDVNMTKSGKLLKLFTPKYMNVSF